MVEEWQHGVWASGNIIVVVLIVTPWWWCYGGHIMVVGLVVTWWCRALLILVFLYEWVLWNRDVCSEGVCVWVCVECGHLIMWKIVFVGMCVAGAVRLCVLAWTLIGVISKLQEVAILISFKGIPDGHLSTIVITLFYICSLQMRGFIADIWVDALFLCITMNNCMFL